MRNKTKADQKREDRRNELWPGSAEWIWDVFDEANTVGFATISRLMPWITVLIRHLSGKGKDPTGIYWELWCRDMGQGFIQISDEQECAYASGYLELAIRHGLPLASLDGKLKAAATAVGVPLYALT